jgi:hypothetical protein
MSDLSNQIHAARMEYWYRYVSEMPTTINTARAEARTLMGRLANPAELTYGDVAAGAICGVQVSTFTNRDRIRQFISFDTRARK